MDKNSKSLMTLKDCVHAKAKTAADEGFVHVPWRTSKLTIVLKVCRTPHTRSC